MRVILRLTKRAEEPPNMQMITRFGASFKAMMIHFAGFAEAMF